MYRKALAASAAILLLAFTQAAPASARDFKVRSADGVEIHGSVEARDAPPAVAVIFVPGTGLFDRDARLGVSGTPRDLIFKDLAERMQARGVTTIRSDVRGVRHGAPAADSFDRTLLSGRTTDNMRDDLAAIYAWSRAPDGLAARCVVFFAHSEGMLHVARLAAQGAPAPALVIGMGAVMESPLQIMLWQSSERDAFSLEMMDADRDGTVTNDEVRANWLRTPSSVAGQLDPLLHPSGAWTAGEIAEVRKVQAALFAVAKAEALARADTEPFIDPENVLASYQWRKSWYLDETPAASALARWGAPVSLHYGELDSQTNAATQTAAANAHFGQGKFKLQVYPGRGHTLGEHVLLGPIDETIADAIAEEAAAIAPSCR